ncbi:MAG TPA: hypothetical protein VLB68_20515 [Pyrinomonadaceae bacterium]|nr:hypothetical protein [Pyrinomonadaceae bacterium]
MDHTFLYSILAGIALVFIIVAARVALRWLVRIALAGVLLLVVVGGLAWWWYRAPARSQTDPRPNTSRRR